MGLSAEDRVALILGRAVMRAEALQVQFEAAQQRVAELEAENVGQQGDGSPLGREE
jgi:hypothetical protein